MQALLIKRYLWLINTISHSSSGISKDEIDRRWASSSVNESRESTYPKRTFLRHKDEIAEIFGVEIAYNRASNTYSIAPSSDIHTDELRKWLLSSFTVNNALLESQQLHQRILTEPIPAGQNFIPTIIEAMRDNRALHVVHGRFGQQTKSFTLHPYCLKVFRQRWYVYGCPSNHPGERRIYALDRISDIQPTDIAFSLPPSFDAEAEFANYYGVFTNLQPELVRIRLCSEGVPFLRTLPLHRSQRETFTADSYSLFDFYVAPTFDFIQQLRTYGTQLIVISPQWLRNQMREEAEKTVLQYQML